MTKQELISEIQRVKETIANAKNPITKKQNTRYLRRLEHKFYTGHYE